MRQADFDTMPIKEVAIVGPDGQTLCTDLGLPLGQRKVHLLGAAARRQLVFARHHPARERPAHGAAAPQASAAGPNAIAALVPAVLFLPQVSSQGGPFSAYAHIATASGALIGNAGERAGRPQADIAWP